MKTLKQFFTSSEPAVDPEAIIMKAPALKKNVSNLSELLRQTKLDAEYEANFVEYNLRRRARSDNCLVPTCQQSNKINRRALSENQLKDNGITAICCNCSNIYYIITSKAAEPSKFCAKDCYSNYTIHEDTRSDDGTM